MRSSLFFLEESEERKRAASYGNKKSKMAGGATFNAGPPGANFHPGPALSLRAASSKVN